MTTSRLALIALLSIPLSLPAGTITQTLGTQVYTDGQIVSSGAFNTDNAGEPAPFNSTQGGDAVANMNVSFSFSFSPILTSITSANILLGLYEAESSAAGSQIALFRLNGTENLTSLLNAVMETSPGVGSQVKFYQVEIPIGALPSLAAGTATFELALTGPGIGILGPTEFNGGGLDFATLSVNFSDPGGEVPEPSSALLAGGALVMGAALLRRRLR
ncbi:MAG: hypothetical protein SFV54_04385 [Bryobacteraceae bacterium]|nr:hypothetical protein [Bryobacteraceae bacterium]